MDVDARMQLFDLKKKYQFLTTPGVDQYNMPLYDVQIEPGNQTIAWYPVYQGFTQYALINGRPLQVQTQRNVFFNQWPDIVQNLQVVATGDGTAGPYILNFPIIGSQTLPLNPPFNAIIRGHVDTSGIISGGTNVDPPVASDATMSSVLGLIPVTSIDSAVFISSIGSDGNPIVVTDSGIFFNTNVNYGMLISPGKAPFGNSVLPPNGVNPAYSLTSNTINYFTGVANVMFPTAIPAGANISVQCRFFQSGLPVSVLFYNNTLTFRSPPALQYLVELEAYLTPAAFLSSGDAIPFAYMAEYLARGAARKILSDTGDIEQFQFYEPLFREQELLVWKRSQRQWTANRTETLYSQGKSNGPGYFGGTIL